MANSCPQPFPQYTLDIALRKFATFDTFVNPDGNELVSILKALAQTADEPRQYFIWGATQTGKSHLLQAVCNQLAGTSQKAVYLPIKDFAKLNLSVLSDLHHLDVICIDDIDNVLGKEKWNQALFRLINELRTANKSLVMTATPNPWNANLSLSGLASRLVWGPVYKMRHLSDEQKQVVIRLQANARGFELASGVCSYLLKRYSRELRKLIELLDHLDAQSLVQQRKVTVPFVKSVLDNF